MNLTETLLIENKETGFGSDLWAWDMVRTVAALFNSGGGTLRVGVNDDGTAVTGIKNPANFSADGGELAKILHAHLDPVPPFDSKPMDGYVEITVREGATFPSILRAPLEHPQNKDRKYPIGTILMRKMNGPRPSSESPKTRSDWQSLLHLWETNRGVTIQGQVIVQFATLVNQWNPFEPGGNTKFIKWQGKCLADVAGPLGRPKLHQGLTAILQNMQPLHMAAKFDQAQDQQGGDYKQPIAQQLKQLCEDLGLIPPQ